MDYWVGVDIVGEYKVILISDEIRFGGYNCIDMGGRYFMIFMEWNGWKNWF